MKVPSIETVGYIPAFFRPNLDGIPIDGQRWIRCHVLVEFVLEASLSQQNVQVMRINLARKGAIGGEFMTSCLLGDTSLEGAFHSVTGEIVGTLLIAAL